MNAATASASRSNIARTAACVQAVRASGSARRRSQGSPDSGGNGSLPLLSPEQQRGVCMRWGHLTLAGSPTGVVSGRIIGHVTNAVRYHPWPVVVEICARDRVPADIEARVRAALHTWNVRWCEISVCCLVEDAPGLPQRWLFGFSAEPLAPGDQVKAERVASRNTVTRYVKGQPPGPDGPPFSIYDRIVHAPEAAVPPGLLRRLIRRA